MQESHFSDQFFILKHTKAYGPPCSDKSLYTHTMIKTQKFGTLIIITFEPYYDLLCLLTHDLDKIKITLHKDACIQFDNLCSSGS